MKITARFTAILLLLWAFLFVLFPRTAQAAICTWNGTTGNWSDTTKWSCGLVPGADDSAVINGGGVTLSNDASVASLTLTGGTLTGAGGLTAATLNWSNGTMEGTGTTTVTNALNFTGTTTIFLSGYRTVNNAGNATWNRSGSLYLAISASFNNLVGATFTIDSAGGNLVYGTGTFRNDGSLTKTSPGSTIIGLPFVNSSTGVVSVESGTLRIDNDLDAISGGAYNVSSGSFLRLTGYTMGGASTGTGTGTIEIAGTVIVSSTLTFPGTISITTGTMNLATDTTMVSTGILAMSGSTLTGPGDLTADTIDWSYGAMRGSGTTTATTALNFIGPGDINLNDSRALNNAGAATWNKAGGLYLTVAAVSLSNLAGATFTVESSGTTLVWGPGTFRNDGTITKTSPGSTSISLPFINSSTGTVSVESGTLTIDNNIAAISSGDYQILSGSLLRLTDYNISGASAVTGAGTIEIFGAVNVSGTLTSSGTISITSGTLNVTTGAAASTGILNMSGGTLTGPGSLTAGTINWGSGTMSGSGSTTATTALNFTGASNIYLYDAHALNNAGAATWNKAGTLHFNAATGSINNLAEATFTVQSAGTQVLLGAGTFKNSGTLNLAVGRIEPGTFGQEAGGVTNLAIRGTTPTTDYGQIHAANLFLSGALNVTFSGGYVPQAGDHYSLVWCDSTWTGDFLPVTVTPVTDIVWVWYHRIRSLDLWAWRFQSFMPLVTLRM